MSTLLRGMQRVVDEGNVNRAANEGNQRIEEFSVDLGEDTAVTAAEVADVNVSMPGYLHGQYSVLRFMGDEDKSVGLDVMNRLTKMTPAGWDMFFKGVRGKSFENKPQRNYAYNLEDCSRSDVVTQYLEKNSYGRKETIYQTGVKLVASGKPEITAICWKDVRTNSGRSYTVYCDIEGREVIVDDANPIGYCKVIYLLEEMFVANFPILKGYRRAYEPSTLVDPMPLDTVFKFNVRFKAEGNGPAIAKSVSVDLSDSLKTDVLFVEKFGKGFCREYSLDELKLDGAEKSDECEIIRTFMASEHCKRVHEALKADYIDKDRNYYATWNKILHSWFTLVPDSRPDFEKNYVQEVPAVEAFVGQRRDASAKNRTRDIIGKVYASSLPNNLTNVHTKTEIISQHIHVKLDGTSTFVAGVGTGGMTKMFVDILGKPATLVLNDLAVETEGCDKVDYEAVSRKFPDAVIQKGDFKALPDCYKTCDVFLSDVAIASPSGTKKDKKGRLLYATKFTRMKENAENWKFQVKMLSTYKKKLAVLKSWIPDFENQTAVRMGVYLLAKDYFVTFVPGIKMHNLEFFLVLHNRKDSEGIRDLFPEYVKDPTTNAESILRILISHAASVQKINEARSYWEKFGMRTHTEVVTAQEEKRKELVEKHWLDKSIVKLEHKIISSGTYKDVLGRWFDDGVYRQVYGNLADIKMHAKMPDNLSPLFTIPDKKIDDTPEGYFGDIGV